jgi:hypothetical protein
MSISEKERQVLESIEEVLAGSGPDLAVKLAMFTRLAEGEAMPSRETVRPPAHLPRARPAAAMASPRAVRAWQKRLSSRTLWTVAFVVLSIALFALIVAVSRGAGKSGCAIQRAAAACRQAPAPAPKPSGAGAVGGH